MVAAETARERRLVAPGRRAVVGPQQGEEAVVGPQEGEEEGEAAEGGAARKRPRRSTAGALPAPPPLPHDTVGAVVVDGRTGAVAAAVSSGGLALKAPGRVGEAAIWGAGCWAADGRAGRGGGTPPLTSTLPPGVGGVAASVSGVGEAVMRAGLARAAAAAVLGDGKELTTTPAAALEAAVVACARDAAGVQPGAPADCGALAVRAVKADGGGGGGGADGAIVSVEAWVAAAADGFAVAWRWEGGGGTRSVGGAGAKVLRARVEGGQPRAMVRWGLAAQLS
jgi:hypothetical protein